MGANAAHREKAHARVHRMARSESCEGVDEAEKQIVNEDTATFSVPQEAELDSKVTNPRESHPEGPAGMDRSNEPASVDRLFTLRLDGRVAPGHRHLLVLALARVGARCELLRCSGRMAGSGPGRWVALGRRAEARRLCRRSCEGAASVHGLPDVAGGGVASVGSTMSSRQLVARCRRRP